MTTEADVFTFVAPTGYGKTSILAQWAREEMAPLGWLSLSREHSNANNLLSQLAASLKRAGVMTIDDVAFFQFMGEDEATTHGASHFARIVEGSGAAPLLIIDRLDTLRRRAVTDVVAELVRQLEGLARVAFASHSEPKIRLSAVRASGRLFEITEDDLEFTIDEVERLLVGLGLDPKLADEVMESTQGWPIAVFLTAIAVRDGQSRSVNARIEGERHLREFVKSEIVPHLSKQRRQFLALMSPLERMSGPLCDAVSTTTGSRRRLESLQSDTHLVYHLDHEGNWFAMNRVLRDVLRNGLEDSAPDVARDVNARAAAWFEANHLPLEAIEHAQTAGDSETFARILDQLIKSRYTAGQVGEVLQWMSWLQANVELDHYPRLAAIGALVHLQEGNVLETDNWLEAAARGAADNDTRSVIGIVQAARIPSGVEQMVRDIETTLDAVDGGSSWLPAILVTRGLALLMSNDNDRAEQSFAEVSKVGLENESLASYVLAQGHRALFAIERQDWEAARSLSDQAVAIIDEQGLDGYHTSGLALIAAARCARRNNDINRAQTFLARASSIRPRLSLAMPGASVYTLTEMAKAHIELSDVASARTLIREAEEIVVQRPDLGVLRAQLNAVKESLATLGPGRIGLPALTKAELRVLPLLATHMSFPEIGEHLFVSRHTVKSQATSIYRKLGCSTRSEAIAKAYDIGLLNH